MKPCKATVTFRKDMGNGIIRTFTNKCCLMAPHDGFKHYSPTLLITCGGDRVERDIQGNDITKTWSPYIVKETINGSER